MKKKKKKHPKTIVVSHLCLHNDIMGKEEYLESGNKFASNCNLWQTPSLNRK